MLVINGLFLLINIYLRFGLLIDTIKYVYQNSLISVQNLWFSGMVLFYLRSIHVILISGDVHVNPGPVNFNKGFFKFCYLNLNSIPAHNYIRISQLEAYNTQHNLDIIALTETALKHDDDCEKIKIEGYTAMRSDLPPNTTHGGVMIFHKDNLALLRRQDLENHPNLLVTEITICNKKIFFTVVYRRFGQTQAEFVNFTNKLNELCSSIKSENPFCSIIVGDFNAHLSNWCDDDVDDNFGLALQNNFNTHGLTQLVNQPTYITDKSSSCIDLIVTDQPNLFLECDIHPSLHTNCHHQMNFAMLNVKCPPPPRYPRRIWHYDRANVECINKAISDYDWDGSLDSCLNIDTQVELFTNVLTNVFTNYIPFDDIIVKPKDPPWFTNNIKSFYNKYKKKYRMYIKNGRNHKDKTELNKMKYD